MIQPWFLPCAGENASKDPVFENASGLPRACEKGSLSAGSASVGISAASAIAGESKKIIELLEECETDYPENVVASDRLRLLSLSFLRSWVPLLLWQRLLALRQLIRPGSCMVLLLCF